MQAEGEDDDLASYTSDVDSLFGMVPAAVQESSSQVVAALPPGGISPPQSSPSSLLDVVKPFYQNAGDIELCDHTLDHLPLPPGTDGTSHVGMDATATGTAGRPTLSLPQEPEGSIPEENNGEQGARAPNT